MPSKNDDDNDIAEDRLLEINEYIDMNSVVIYAVL